LLLEMLTPIAKSWPSEWCLEANSLAIQIHGGYGYTRDFPVEQYWRDNRLNMIHEGTHGIQALDLLGRKVVMQEGKGLKLLANKITQTTQRAQAIPQLKAHADDLKAALNKVALATQAAWATNNPSEALANAVPYMQAFGHTVIAWMWLDVVLVDWVTEDTPDRNMPITSISRSQTCNYFYQYELPKIEAWLKVVSARDTTCATFPEEAF
jgi:Acetyl-CoA dehydrogenase C-terminal like/Acyl-CoA dehydrogenase, C-terminal domain